MSKLNDQVIMQAIKDPNFSFIESFADASDSSKVTREMTTLLFKHRKARDILKEQEREKVRLEKELRTLRQSAYLRHKDAPNEKHRGVLVDIETEDVVYKIAIVDQRIKEVNRILSSIKLEIDTWKAISYSLRTEMGSF